MTDRARTAAVRRRKLKETARKQMLPGAYHVIAVATLFFTAVGTAASYGTGLWTQGLYGTRRVDVMEIFGGHSEVSMEATRQ